MADKFLSSRSGIYIIVFLITIPILIAIITGVCLMDYQVVYILIVPLLSSIFLVSLRKTIFAKIEISNEGIARFYKKEVIHFISWNNLVEIRFVPKYCVLFLDSNMDSKAISNSKTIVWFWINSRKINIMLKYKDKFKGKITNPGFLGEKTKRLLTE